MKSRPSTSSMRAPSARATARGGVLTPRATCWRRASITRSVAIPSVVAMAPSSTSVRGFANGLLTGLFLARQLELACLHLLGDHDCLVRRLGRAGLPAAGEDNPERYLGALRLGALAQLRLLAQLVDVVARAVVVLGPEALVELRAGVAGHIHVLAAAAGGKREHGQDEQCGEPGAHAGGTLASAIGQKRERALEARRPREERGLRAWLGRPSCGRPSPSRGRRCRTRSCRPGSGGACAARASSARNGSSAGGGGARNGS